MRDWRSVEMATKIAWSLHGLPYIWGGDDTIEGFDCSGLVIEILKSVGVIARKGDWTAKGLYDLFLPHQVSVPKEGCLLFWKSATSKIPPYRIVHVEYCLNEELAIGASGGGSRSKTAQDAARLNAYVKVRPFYIRENIAGFADPFEVS